MSTIAGRKRNHQGDYSDLAQSRVLHLRGLPGHTLELDLLDVFNCFGHVKYVSMIPDSHQALLEYYDLKSATEVVAKYRESGIALANGTIVKLNYSTSKSISLRDVDDVEKAESPILGVTVYRANYPIHTELIHKIVSQHGKPLKILIIRKKNIVAFVEFGSIEEAKQVKMHLNGADIYSACCSLKVDFAPNRPLRITHNDQEQWDEALEAINQLRGNLPHNMRNMLGNGSGSLLGGSPPNSSMNSSSRNSLPNNNGNNHMNNGQNSLNFRGLSGNNGNAQSNAGLSTVQMMHLVESLNRGGISSRLLLEAASMSGNQLQSAAAFANLNQNSVSDHHTMMSNNSMNSSNSAGMLGNITAVVMVYGFNMNDMNCERVFNILCLYGNVARVKFLHSKEGACMVQMGDEIAAQNLIDNFSGAVLFGNRILIHASKQKVLQPVLSPYLLPDESQSYKDFSHSLLNRFMTRDKALKNRICRPVATLHFWNCPPQFNESDIVQLFTEPLINKPVKVLLFNKSEKSSSGLIEWNTAEEATNALAICNHRSIILGDASGISLSAHTIPSGGSNSGSSPWYIKLSYSQGAIKR